MSDARGLYLDLLKRCLLGLTVDDGSRFTVESAPGQEPRVRLGPRPRELSARLEGRDLPTLAHTMIGQARLDNLQACAESVLADGVPGDFIETGVWRGGATILMRAVLKVHGVTDRRVWAADSFQGLPAPDVARYPHDAGLDLHRYAELAVPLREVRRNFERYGLLDEQVCFLKGWFRDTLPKLPVPRLALVRLDGDLYESTLDGLSHLYPKLSVGGYLIVDDYAIPACRQAVHDYRGRHGIEEPIEAIDWSGVYWRRRRGEA